MRVEAIIRCDTCGHHFRIEARSEQDLRTVLSIAHKCACCAVIEYVSRYAAFALQKEAPPQPYSDGYE